MAASERLRAEKYGGFADWDVLAHVSIDERGGLEDTVKARLCWHGVVRQYIKDGFAQDAIELFRCSFSLALEARNSSLIENTRSQVWRSSYSNEYEFK